MYLSRDQRIESLKAIVGAVPQIINEYHRQNTQAIKVVNPDFFIEQVLAKNLSELINQLSVQEDVDFKAEEIADIINHIYLVHEQIVQILKEEEIDAAISYLDTLRQELSVDDSPLGMELDTEIQGLREEIDELDNKLADRYVTLVDQGKDSLSDPDIAQLLNRRFEVVLRVANWKFKMGYRIDELRDLSREYFIIERLRIWLQNRWHNSLEKFYIEQVFAKSNELQRQYFLKKQKN